MGILIRTARLADTAGIAKVQIDTWRTTYTGIVPAQHLAGLSYGNCQAWWEDVLARKRPRSSTYVAEANGCGVVGFADGGPERDGNLNYMGELYSIYILKEYQGRGVGRRLVSAVVRSLLTCQMNSMLLWVLKDNHPSRRFYEALGGECVGQKAISIGGVSILEVAYGWNNIEGLAGQQLRGHP